MSLASAPFNPNTRHDIYLHICCLRNERCLDGGSRVLSQQPGRRTQPDEQRLQLSYPFIRATIVHIIWKVSTKTLKSQYTKNNIRIASFLTRNVRKISPSNCREITEWRLTRIVKPTHLHVMHAEVKKQTILRWSESDSSRRSMRHIQDGRELTYPDESKSEIRRASNWIKHSSSKKWDYLIISC